MSSAHPSPPSPSAIERRRRPWLVAQCALVLLVATVVAVATGTMVAAHRPVVYRSAATVDLRTLLGSDNPSFENVDKAEREVTNQSLAAESADVVDATISSLGMLPADAAAFSADSVSGTDALSLTATANDPTAAATRARTYAQVYIRTTLARRTSVLDAQRTEVEGALRAVDAAVINPRSGFTAAVKQAQQQSLAARLGQIVTARSSVGAGGAASYLLEAAQVPTAPAGFMPWMWGAAAGVASFITTAGVLGGLVYGRARSRRRV